MVLGFLLFCEREMVLSARMDAMMMIFWRCSELHIHTGTSTYIYGKDKIDIGFFQRVLLGIAFPTVNMDLFTL